MGCGTIGGYGYRDGKGLSTESTVLSLSKCVLGRRKTKEIDMIVERKSPFTGITRKRDLPITEEQIKAWQDGALIQNVFPNLSAGDREFIKTGITDEEWDEAFGE
jgi:hypothetical protein